MKRYEILQSTDYFPNPPKLIREVEADTPGQAALLHLSHSNVFVREVRPTVTVDARKLRIVAERCFLHSDHCPDSKSASKELFDSAIEAIKESRK